MGGSSPRFGPAKEVSVEKPGGGVSFLLLVMPEREIPGFSLPRSLPWRESLGRGENVGFNLFRYYLCPSFIEGDPTKGVGLRVANSHTGNHHDDDFTSLETIRRFLGVVGSRSLSSLEGRPSSRIEG
ncbi:hypothetical protein Tco_0082232, partial [Tanacetum coccineum]